MGKLMLMAMLVSGLILTAQVNDRRRLRSEAFSQSERVQNEAQMAFWRFGRFSATPRLGLGQLGYESNLYSTVDEEVSDFSLAPKAGLKAFFRLSPHWILSSEADLDYQWYKDEAQLRGWAPSYKAYAHALYRRIYWNAGVAYQKGFGRINSEVIDRRENETKTLETTMVLQVTPKGYVKAQWSKQAFSFLDSTSELREYNHDQTQMSLTYLYQWRASFWPFVEYKNTEGEYEDFSLPLTSDQSTVFVGLRNEGGTRLQYHVKIGTSDLSLDYTATNVSEISGSSSEPIWESFFKYYFRRHWYAEWGANRQMVLSRFLPYSHFWSDRYLFGMGYRTAKNVEFGPDLYFGKNQYQLLESEALDTTGYEDHLNLSYRSVNFNFSFPVAHQIRLKLTVGLEDRELIQQEESVSGWYGFVESNWSF
jgi:hypothetical protein